MDPHYPAVCPICLQPAYVGVVPASVSCSNVFCRHAEKARCPRAGDYVTLHITQRPDLSARLTALDGKRVKVVHLYFDSVEVSYTDQGDQTVATAKPVDIVELWPYLVVDLVTGGLVVPAHFVAVLKEPTSLIASRPLPAPNWIGGWYSVP